MSNPSDCAPLNVLITGASSGIGRATGLEEAAAEMRAAGAKEVVVCAGDVTEEDQIRAAVSAATGRFGRLDVVVHSAQVMAYGTVEQVPREVYETVVDTALHGTANLARVVLPVFR